MKLSTAYCITALTCLSIISMFVAGMMIDEHVLITLAIVGLGLTSYSLGFYLTQRFQAPKSWLKVHILSTNLVILLCTIFGVVVLWNR